VSKNSIARQPNGMGNKIVYPTLKKTEVLATSVPEHGNDGGGMDNKNGIVEGFKSWLSEDGKSWKTVESYVGDLVGFLAYLEKMELERLLFYIQGPKVNIRDRAIVMVLLYTGARVSELCSITIKHIDFLTNHIRIAGKGGKLREVPMKPEVVEAVKQYLTERIKNKYSDSEYLFLGQRGTLQRDGVNTLLESLAKKAHLDIRLKPHTFRHTFCTKLVKRGVPITTVSKLAGHSSIETTARFYVNSSREDKKKAVNML